MMEVPKTEATAAPLPAAKAPSSAAPAKTQPTKTRAVKTAAAKPKRPAPSATSKAAAKSPAAAQPKAPAKLPVKAAAKLPSKVPRKTTKQRPKLIRDGFTMPEADFALIAALKSRALGARREAKKSELLRAGLRALAALDSKALVAALDLLEPVKTGRPKKGH